MSTAATEKGKPIGKAGLLEVATNEELKQLGWRVDKLDSGWSAYEINGDRKIGPASSISALKTQVMLASGPVATNGNGKRNGKDPGLAQEAAETDFVEPRLPTMEEPEIDDLNRQADNCIAALEKKKQATTASKDEDDIMRYKMREHGRKRYSRRGFSIVLEESEKLVIKKAEQGQPKNPSTRKPTIIKG